MYIVFFVTDLKFIHRIFQPRLLPMALRAGSTSSRSSASPYRPVIGFDDEEDKYKTSFKQKAWLRQVKQRARWIVAGILLVILPSVSRATSIYIRLTRTLQS